MAETAKILNPEKTVLLPAKKAGCSLAESITAEDVRNLKKKFPGVPVVTYVNTYADVKAETDICCTSGNAVSVVEAIDSDTIIFLPDEFLAKNVAKETGKHIIFPSLFDKQDNILDYQIIGWSYVYAAAPGNGPAHSFRYMTYLLDCEGHRRQHLEYICCPAGAAYGAG